MQVISEVMNLVEKKRNKCKIMIFVSVFLKPSPKKSVKNYLSDGNIFGSVIIYLRYKF